ncbi:MAG: winged helix-turn-helix domain-containing protein [Rhodobacteraceae bacterium]|nr:winged helix-turn-helix domain-containing protein [Paracoccaceae bacterium]
MSGAGALPEVRRQVSTMPAAEAVDYLLELLANLMGDEHDKIGDCPDMRLSPSQLVVFRRLYRSEGNTVTRESLLNLLYLDRSDPPNDEVIRTFISQIRSKLPPGVSIEPVWGSGYRLTRVKGVRFSWETRDPAAVGG